MFHSPSKFLPSCQHSPEVRLRCPCNLLALPPHEWPQRDCLQHESFLAKETGTEEKHSAPAHMSTACAVDHKRTFHTTDTIPLPMLLPTAIRTMLSARWCARFAATLPPDSMLSRCSYSVVDAIHLFETGEGPIELILRSPGSAFPVRNRGFLRIRGVIRHSRLTGGWSRDFCN